MRGIFNCQLATRDVRDCRDIPARKDTDYKRHVQAWFFNVFGYRVVVIINGVLMNCSISVSMTHHMSVSPPVRVAENKAEVIVAGVASRCF